MVNRRWGSSTMPSNQWVPRFSASLFFWKSRYYGTGQLFRHSGATDERSIGQCTRKRMNHILDKEGFPSGRRGGVAPGRLLSVEPRIGIVMP